MVTIGYEAQCAAVARLSTVCSVGIVIWLAVRARRVFGSVMGTADSADTLQIASRLMCGLQQSRVRQPGLFLRVSSPRPGRHWVLY